jgi:2-polyprenyl-6-methoxyphenol hydroxylase-like FAD-dependent oxidoreductase
MSLFHKPILIIRAGISGLACARILNSYRIPSIIFESSLRSRKQGYGITLRSWAYSHFLQSLRISTDGPVGGKGYISSTIFDAYTGKPLTSARPARSNSKMEGDFFRVNRHQLREYLADGLDVRYEHELISFQSKTDGLVAKFRNGQTIEGTILIGADGVFSRGM